MKKIIFGLILTVIFSISAFAQYNTSKSADEASKLLSRGDVPGAVAVLDRAIEKKKDLLEAYKMRAFLRPMLGDTAGGLDDLTKAIEIKPDDGELYERRAMMRLRLRQDNSLILKDLDMAIANGKKLEKIYTFRASLKRESDDIEGAISDYQTAIGLRPDLAQAHVGLSSIYSINGDDEKAASILESFLFEYENSLIKAPPLKGKVVAESSETLSPNKNSKGIEGVQTIIVTGEEVSQMPTSPGQMDAFGDRLEQSKNTALAYTNLAGIYEKRGDYEKALQTVEKAMAIDPSDFYAFIVRGRVKTSMKDYKGAFEDLSRAIKTSPSIPSAYADRGILLLLMNRDEDAQKDFDRFLKIMSSPNAKTALEKRIADTKKTREENK